MRDFAPQVPDAALHELEARVVRALDSDDVSALQILGFGETGVAMIAPDIDPDVVFKRLPPFESAAEFERYAQVLRQYLDLLASRDVHMAPSLPRLIVRADGQHVGYLLQRWVRPEQLVVNVLARCDEASGRAIVADIVGQTMRACEPPCGFDPQVTNWALLDGRAVNFDVTTPFLRGPDGKLALDFELFARAMPWIMRVAMRPIMESFVGRWMNARGALLDFGGHLWRNNLYRWRPVAMEEINRHLQPGVTIADFEAVDRGDNRLWPFFLRLKKTGRWWTRHVRGRRYEFLLPEHSSHDSAEYAEQEK